MSILHDVSARQLRPAVAQLRTAQTLGTLNVALNDALGGSIGPAVEQFLCSVATLEVGLALGIANPLRDSDLGSIREIFSHDAIGSYCAAYRLTLPSRFEQRLTTSSLSRSDDGASNPDLMAIDVSQHREQVSQAFSDLIVIGRSLNTNQFVNIARQLPVQQVVGDASDEDLVAALSMLSGNPNEDLSSGTNDKLYFIAMLIEAMKDFEFQIAELADVFVSVRTLSAHGDATKDLISSHLLPDATRLSASYGKFAERLRVGLEHHFAVSAKRASLGRLLARRSPALEFDLGADFEIAADTLDDGGDGPRAVRTSVDSVLVTRIQRTTTGTQSQLGRFARPYDTVVSMQSGADARNEANRLRMQRLRSLVKAWLAPNVEIGIMPLTSTR